jgi:hypothetical protein
MVLFFVTFALVIFLTIFPKIEPRKSHLTYFIKVDPMRNRFALSFLWLSLAFLPIACNPKSDDRGARGNSSQPKNNTGTPDSLGVNVTGLNSGGGATFTFKPDPSGNTASYLLTITDAAGEDTVTSVCADSIFNCAFFEKATSIKTSNCNSEGNCSAATEVESIPTCNEDGEFSGKVNEIVSDLQALAQQERNLAEEFIEYNEDIYTKLEDKETNVATQIKAISDMHPCDLLASNKEFIDALAKLSIDGEANPEMIAGLVVSILAATAGIVGTVAYFVRNQEQFLKNLKDAQDTAKTNLAEAKAKLTALEVDGADSTLKHTEATKALEDAKLNDLTFSDDALALLGEEKKKFKFGTADIEMKSDDFAKVKTFAQIDSKEKFENLSAKDKTYLKETFKVENFDEFNKKDGLRQKGLAFLDDTSKALTTKLDELLKDSGKNTDAIAKLKEAGVKSTAEKTKLEEDVKKWSKIKDDFANTKAEVVKGQVKKMLLEGVKSGKVAELKTKLDEVKKGNLDPKGLQEAIGSVFGKDSKLYKLVKTWAPENFSKNSEILQKSVDKISDKHKPASFTDMIQRLSLDIQKGLNAGASYSSDQKVKAGLNATDNAFNTVKKAMRLVAEEMTADQKLLKDEYIPMAVAYAEELLEISGAKNSLNSELVMIENQSLQASTPAAPSNPQ